MTTQPAMEQPRRATRYRGEPPPKRRALTPSPPPVPKAKPQPQHPPEPLEEGMPVKLKETGPLPVVNKPQGPDTSDKAFQTVIESNVLRESLERSRQRWMTGAVFERYWTKPSKKKGAIEPAQPERGTMHKLGNCTMVVEPHTFEITLFTVKDNSHVQQPSFHATPPAYSHYNPYPQSGNYAPPFGPPFTGTSIPDANPPAQQRRPSQPSLPGFREGFGHADTNTPPVPPAPSPAPAPSRRQSKSSNSSQESRLKENASTDPVIQMLAQRAGQDARLKSLMTIVAAGDASSEQLKEFQSHIDELNTLLKSPTSPNAPPDSAKPATHPTGNSPLPPPPQPPAAKTAPSASSPPPPQPTAANNPIKVENPYQTQHPIPRPQHPPYQNPYSYPPPPAHRTHVFPSNPSAPHVPYNPAPAPPTTIVFDFSGQGSNGDRFLIPRNSILEYLPGNLSVLVSFLVTRSGSAAASLAPSTAAKQARHAYYKASKQYYELVTLRLSAAHPRFLEPLQRVVNPPDEVRKYMDGVFDKVEKAQRVWVAARLPREKGAAAEDKEKDKEKGTPMASKEGGRKIKGRESLGAAVEKASDGVGTKPTARKELVKAVYEAPNSMMPWPG